MNELEQFSAALPTKKDSGSFPKRICLFVDIHALLLQVKCKFQDLLVVKLHSVLLNQNFTLDQLKLFFRFGIEKQIQENDL